MRPERTGAIATFAIVEKKEVLEFEYSVFHLNTAVFCSSVSYCSITACIIAYQRL